MTPERWEQVTEIYTAALELPRGDRPAFLSEICAGDEELKREVESLLQADSEAGDFIDQPAVKDHPSLLASKEALTLTGNQLAHYRIINHLGRGGMGEVYLAEDTKLNRKVALKLLPEEYSADPVTLQRFETEARAAANLNHAGIATIYSVEKVDGCHFITLEYVQGKTLSDMIPEKGLDIKLFLDWFISIADAFAHSHEKGIIHRDIKPKNIMITDDGRPKVLDFGLAKIDHNTISHDTSTLNMTQPGQVMGTPSYMSPEQAEGKEIDPRTDIFSLGVVMYQAITGKRPFSGDNYAQIISKILNSEPEPIQEIRPDAPYLLTRLINRCLSKSRQQRIQTMREVRVILEEAEATIEAGISTNSLAKRILSEQVRWMSPRIVIPVLAVVVAALSVLAFYYFRKDLSPPMNFENMTQRKLSQTNNVVYAHVSPDGKWLAYNTIDEADNRSLWIRRIDDKNSLQLVPYQPVFYWNGLAFSNDGSQIYYVTAPREGKHGTMYKVSTLGGQSRKLAEVANDIGGLSPEGDRIIFVRRDERTTQILTVNASDGGDERIILSSGLNQTLRDPQFSADGKKIYFIRLDNRNGDEYWTLEEIDASGANPRVIISERKPRISEIKVLKDGTGMLVNAVDEDSNLQQLFHVALPDGKRTRITNDLNFYFGISASDDGRTIVAAQRNSTRDVWIASGENFKDKRKLTTESNVYSSAVFAPDGRIVYDATDNNRPHIWIMNADGSSPQQLTTNEYFDYEARVSLDGRFIFFTSQRTGERKVWRANIDGSDPQIMTPAEQTAFGPVVAPDGQNVLFHRPKEKSPTLGIVPVGGGEITEKPYPGEGGFAFSPDGKWVAEVFYDEPVKKYKVRVRSLMEEAGPIVFDFSPTNVFIWTQDSKALLYKKVEAASESTSTVWRQAIEGGAPTPFLSTSPDTIYYLSLSKDGKQAVIVRGKFTSDAVMLSKTS